MKTVSVLSAAILAAALNACAQQTGLAAAPTADAAAPCRASEQQPDVAAPQCDPRTGQVNAHFLDVHQKYLGVARQGKAQLVFLGDSITAGWGWPGYGTEVWVKSFSRYQPANFGVSSDRTQNLLWRIENGELDGLEPKAIVLMIGTNNGADSAQAIAQGIAKIVRTIRAKLPATKILLLGVFPRGSKPDGRFNEQHFKLEVVNAALAKLDDRPFVHFMDIGERFVRGKPAIDPAIQPDFLHLSAAGYQIWADAIADKLAELMK